MAGLDNITLIAGRQQYQTDITNLSTEELLKTYRVNIFQCFRLSGIAIFPSILGAIILVVIVSIIMGVSNKSNRQ